MAAGSPRARSQDGIYGHRGREVHDHQGVLSSWWDENQRCEASLRGNGSSCPASD